MKLRKISQTGVGTSNYIPVDVDVYFFLLTNSTVLTGTATYTIQATVDDVFAPDFNPSTADWLPLAGAFTNLTAGTRLNSGIPVTAVRLLVSSGSGTVVLSLRQAGIG